ncbi:Serum paraoxonase/arylesterase 2 [hydrothermal vent metagenome]|uniref:Serum paraoxonase/arylesterase 2 n=1 Tax=hydrothermal vent metagenome TaxID=652676 RepID=A0A3B0SXK8_9ZZZZ
MSLIKKIVLTFLVILIVFVVYTVVTTGFFRTIDNKFDGQLVKKVPLFGTEDITVSTIDGFALISSTKRETMALEAGDGELYLMDMNSGEYQVTNLTASFQKPFAPHGISMLKIDSTYKVMAVNHTPTGHSLEVFSMKDNEMTHKKTLTDKSMVSPNDVVIIDENRFYFTNDHAYTGMSRLLEDYGGLSVSNVVYYDGENYSEVATGIGYANGINFDPKRNLLFVASPRKFLVKVYARNTDGSLEFIEDIPCGTGVDNIEFDSEGNLLIGAHPSLLTFTAYMAGKIEFAPSEVVKISYRGKGDFTVESIFLDDGTTISASTVAAPYKDLILVGNLKDDALLVLKKE